LVPKKTSEEVVDIEDKQLRDYELVLIINPEVAGENFDATLDNVTQFLTEKGGIISDIERWGKKKLAYPIEHFAEGSYVLVRFRFNSALGK